MKKIIALASAVLLGFMMLSCGSTSNVEKSEPVATTPRPSVNNHPTRMGGGEGGGIISKE